MKQVIALLAACAATAPASAVVVQWTGAGSNGHYYEYVQTGATFDDAIAAAAASSYNGQQGYLTTITSSAEQAFIYGSVTTAGFWAGGSDAALEGTWKWVTGPEAGTVFW